MKKVIIIGSGIGGLTTAVRLLHKGYDVTILEKEGRVGGKVNLLESRGARFDLTATLVMTPNIYTDVFKECGKNYEDYFTIKNIDPIYKVYFSDKRSYEFSKDVNEVLKEMDSIKNGLSNEYMNFLLKSSLKYTLSKENFLDKPMISKKEILNIKILETLMKINPMDTTDEYLNKIFTDKNIINFLLFQSMYIGINPYTNSNIYTLIPAISQMYGLWYVEGGLYSYIESLEKLIKELGGKIELKTEAKQIKSSKKGLKYIITNKEIYKGDIIINNTDYPYSVEKLFKSKNNKMEISCSVFIIYLGLKKKYNDLQVHNVYIGDNFRENLEAPFKGKLPLNPSLYMYYPSKIDNKIIGEYESILNIMVRVPNLCYKNIRWDEKSIKKYRDLILYQIKRIDGLEDIEENILYENYLTPKIFKDRFNTYYGNAFGVSHKLSQTTYFRPHIKDKNIQDLYHIGSSTHPGNGVSVVIGGSKVLVNEILKKDKII